MPGSMQQCISRKRQRRCLGQEELVRDPPPENIEASKAVWKHVVASQVEGAICFICCKLVEDLVEIVTRLCQLDQAYHTELIDEQPRFASPHQAQGLQLWVGQFGIVDRCAPIERLRAQVGQIVAGRASRPTNHSSVQPCF